MSCLTKLNRVMFLFVFIFYNISITDFIAQGKKNQMNNNIPVTRYIKF